MKNDYVENAGLVKDAIRELLAAPHNTSPWAAKYLHGAQAMPERFITDLTILRRRLKPGASVLDVGAAPFIISHALKTLGFRVSVTDVNPERFSHFTLPYVVERLDLNEPAEPSTKYDAVIVHELVEHLRINLIKSFEFLRDTVSADGEIFISTPNLLSLVGLYRLICKKTAYSCGSSLYAEWNKIALHGHMGHVREYTARELIEFSREIGLSPTELTYRGKFSGKGAAAANFLAQIVPAWKPFFSLVLKKTA